MDIFTYKTFLGPLTIVATGRCVTHVFFNNKFKIKGARYFENNLIKRTYLQICEYFDGRRDTFDIPLRLFETEHGESVRKVVEKIPYGQSLTYKEISDILGNPNSQRATGNYVRSAHVVIIIPFHRAIGIGGRSTGFEEDTRINNELLKLEQKYLNLFR